MARKKRKSYRTMEQLIRGCGLRKNKRIQPGYGSRVGYNMIRIYEINSDTNFSSWIYRYVDTNIAIVTSTFQESAPSRWSKEITFIIPANMKHKSLRKLVDNLNAIEIAETEGHISRGTIEYNHGFTLLRNGTIKYKPINEHKITVTAGFTMNDRGEIDDTRFSDEFDYECSKTWVGKTTTSW